MSQGGLRPTRCSRDGCGRELEVPARSLGRAVRCPACGRDFTARPLEVLRKLEARERKVQAGDFAGAAPEREASPRGQRRYLFHAPPEGAPQGEALAADPMWEASLDREAPLAPPVDLVAILDDLRSQWNVGAIFRTADAAGLAGLWLAGITATPPARIVAKTALGAEAMVPWTYHASVVHAIHAAKAEGREVWALELGEGAEAVFEVVPPRCGALVLGNEVVGVSGEALELCSRRVAIPMSGRKGSLNVAVAFGVAAFALARAWRKAYSS